MNLKISELVIPAFHDSWRAHNKFTHNVEKGGRNTGKSSTHAQRLVYNRMRSKTSGIALRRYANTIHDSIFQDVIWAIKKFNCQHLWTWKTSPHSFMYTPTGTTILFRGADQVEKIKGIKAEYPITDCLFSELAEFRNEEDLDTVINTILRADVGEDYRFYYDYNPPKRKNNWCNKKYNTKRPMKNTRVHHTTTFDNPYIAKQVLEEAENMKKLKPLMYRWMYLGEAIGGGVVPFDNLEFRTITDEEIATFDNIKIGLDWGYANDIFACIKLHYDSTRRIIYMMDEIWGLKLKNWHIKELLMDKNFNDFRIAADSASPKDIDTLKESGFDIFGVKKGPGSVEFGEKWIDSQNKIVIDYNRTPKCAEQFENIDYAVDVRGEIISRLADKDNDFIDATRYACEEIILDNDMLY